MQYLLDTSICVFFLRGKHNLNRVFQNKGLSNCFISEITIAELRYGAENSDNSQKSHLAVDDFVNGLTVIPILGSIRQYAIEKVRLRKLGTPIHDEFDLLIGVTAVEHQLTLVTDNVNDFKRLERIQIENWIVR